MIYFGRKNSCRRSQQRLDCDITIDCDATKSFHELTDDFPTAKTKTTVQKDERLTLFQQP